MKQTAFVPSVGFFEANAHALAIFKFRTVAIVCHVVEYGWHLITWAYGECYGGHTAWAEAVGAKEQFVDDARVFTCAVDFVTVITATVGAAKGALKLVEGHVGKHEV